MADVFVSYKKSDRDRVRPLVDLLREADLEVWWDEGIAPSMSWRAEIAKQLAAARCVVAVWTRDSVDPEAGRWVMEEATHALQRRVLAPVRLDLVSPPLGFGEVQYADLAAWNGKGDDPRFQHFLAVVQAIVRSEPVAVGPTPTQFEAPGVKMQNVRLENVRIEVVEREAEGDEADDAPPPDAPRQPSRPRGEPVGLLFARVVGVVLPLMALMTYVFTIGTSVCARGNAPAVLCNALAALSSPLENEVGQ